MQPFDAVVVADDGVVTVDDVVAAGFGELDDVGHNLIPGKTSVGRCSCKGLKQWRRRAFPLRLSSPSLLLLAFELFRLRKGL